MRACDFVVVVVVVADGVVLRRFIAPPPVLFFRQSSGPVVVPLLLLLLRRSSRHPPETLMIFCGPPALRRYWWFYLLFLLTPVYPFFSNFCAIVSNWKVCASGHFKTGGRASRSSSTGSLGLVNAGSTGQGAGVVAHSFATSGGTGTVTAPYDQHPTPATPLQTARERKLTDYDDLDAVSHVHKRVFHAGSAESAISHCRVHGICNTLRLVGLILDSRTPFARITTTTP
jgi:hypothetical protein